MKFIAHRGFAARYPENTIEAMDAVFAYPLFKTDIIGIELDIQLSKDNKIVVFHDEYVKDGENKINVADIDYQALKEYAKKLPSYYGSDRVPLFHEILEKFSHKTTFFVEIKDGPYNHELLMDMLAELFKKHTPLHDIVIHSFSVPIMKLALDKLSSFNIEYGFLCSSKDSFDGLEDDFIKAMDFIHPMASWLLEDQKCFLDCGKPLNNVWTVNDVKLIKKLKMSKVYSLIIAVTTDDLDVIGEWKKSESAIC